MCSRIIAARARLSGEEQAIVHRCGEFGSAIRLAGQGVRIGAAREWISAPTFQLERLHPSGEIAAEQGDELADGKIDESNILSCLEFGCQAAAEISLDVGSAERAEMINASLAAIRRISSSNSSACERDRNSLSARPKGRPSAACVFFGRRGLNTMLSSAMSALGTVTMAASAAIDPCAVSTLSRHPL